jgi:hypothetical protein
MKKILVSLVAAATLSFSSFGQAPEGFKYQAVVRDAGNTILNSQTVGLRMTIQQGAIGGTTVYAETFAPTTNAYGLVNLEIGNGTVVSGTFANIDWSAGPYFMETAVDVTGGTNYSVMGTSQLMSVPYALYAKTSGNGQGPEGPQGIQGPAGVDGTNGTNGTNGIDGVDGAQGPQGIQGPAGVDGTNGTNGIDGADGATGPQGIQGIAGIDGATGPQGPQGLTGPQGTQGIQGIAGTNGIDGVDGVDGQDGATGPMGPQGPAGLNGADGNDGLDGATGPMGPQGPAGPAGNDGATGPTGPQGIQGIAGNDGAQGPQGPAGNDGAAGATGPQGPAGNDGATGPAGADGQGGVTTAGSGINVTGAGTVVSPYVVSATSPCGLAIGQTYQGGIIFYLDASGCHGLLSAPTDQSTSAPWANADAPQTTAYGSGLFDGKYNTFIIMFGGGGTTTAAAICENLTLGGYSDWYLPSFGELDKMYDNIGPGNALGLGNVGGFATSWPPYWSSTEFSLTFSSGPSINNALYKWFGTGGVGSADKNSAYYVRAIRAF